MTERFLINPEGQTDDEVVDFIMGILEGGGELEEARLVEHPGHPDQKVHAGGRGGGEVTGKIGEPVAAANAVMAGKHANVSSADLDEALYHLAANSPPGKNLMVLHCDGKRVTGDTGLPISRDKMPQFDGDVKSQFIGELEASGTRVDRKSVDPSSLRPGQNEIDAMKTSGMFRAIDQGKMGSQDPIIVSSDNRVIDGNHRFAALSAARQDGHPDVTIDILQVDMPASQLLPFAQSWTTSHGVASRALGT